MGKTKKPKKQGVNRKATIKTALPQVPDTFKISDIIDLVSKLNTTIETLTRQLEKERKAHRLQLAKLDKKANKDSKKNEELMSLVAELTQEIKKLRSKTTRTPTTATCHHHHRGIASLLLKNLQMTLKRKVPPKTLEASGRKKVATKGASWVRWTPVVSPLPFQTRPMSSSISAISVRLVQTCLNAWTSIWSQQALREMNMR